MDAKTEVDEFTLAQVTPLLAPGETVIAWAYLVQPVEGRGAGVFVSAASAGAAFAVITSHRLRFIETRIGAFKPLLENHGVASFERAEIKGAHVGAKLLIELADGRLMEYQNNVKAKLASTQGEFFAQLVAIFGVSQAATKVAAANRSQAVIGTVIGIVAAGLYLLYKLTR